jgi:hypothetical protein
MAAKPALKAVGREGPPKTELLRLYVDLDGESVPVVEDPRLAALFRHRDKADLEALAASILAIGQESKVLLLRDAGKLIVIDGHDVCRAVATLQMQGHPIQLAYTLYEPKETSPELVYLEVMALIIRRKLAATTVTQDAETKSAAILTFLKTSYVNGIYPTSRWVAADLCCSHTWVDNVRKEAIEEGDLPLVDPLYTRKGKRQPLKERPAAPTPSVGKDILPLNGAGDIRTEDEELEAPDTETDLDAELQAAVDASPEGHLAAARARAEAEADRLLQEAADASPEGQAATKEQEVQRLQALAQRHVQQTAPAAPAVQEPAAPAASAAPAVQEQPTAPAAPAVQEQPTAPTAPEAPAPRTTLAAAPASGRIILPGDPNWADPQAILLRQQRPELHTEDDVADDLDLEAKERRLTEELDRADDLRQDGPDTGQAELVLAVLDAWHAAADWARDQSPPVPDYVARGLLDLGLLDEHEGKMVVSQDRTHVKTTVLHMFRAIMVAWDTPNADHVRMADAINKLCVPTATRHKK